MHGVIMVWFFLIPSIPATLGNFLVPLMIGARDLAFPRLNLASWYLYVRRRLVHPRRAGRRRRRHRLDVLHAVLDAVLEHARHRGRWSGVFIAGFSSILTGLNFIVTMHKLRAPGMTWFRLPLFVWAHLRDQHHPRARDAGAGDDAVSLVAIERLFARRHLRSRRSAAIRCCSSISSGSTRTRPSTS